MEGLLVEGRCALEHGHPSSSGHKSRPLLTVRHQQESYLKKRCEHTQICILVIMGYHKALNTHADIAQDWNGGKIGRNWIISLSQVCGI